MGSPKLTFHGHECRNYWARKVLMELIDKERMIYSSSKHTNNVYPKSINQSHGIILFGWYRSYLRFRGPPRARWGFLSLESQLSGSAVRVVFDLRPPVWGWRGCQYPNPIQVQDRTELRLRLPSDNSHPDERHIGPRVHCPNQSYCPDTSGIRLRLPSKGILPFYN